MQRKQLYDYVHQFDVSEVEELYYLTILVAARQKVIGLLDRNRRYTTQHLRDSIITKAWDMLPGSDVSDTISLVMKYYDKHSNFLCIKVSDYAPNEADYIDGTDF